MCDNRINRADCVNAVPFGTDQLLGVAHWLFGLFTTVKPVVSFVM